MRFLDEEMGTAAELRHVRLLVHDAVERTGMCVYFHVFSVYVSRCVCGACVRVYICVNTYTHIHTHIELAPISLKEDVNAAFSQVRTTINAAVQVEHLRNGCLEAVEDCESKCR